MIVINHKGFGCRIYKTPSSFAVEMKVYTPNYMFSVVEKRRYGFETLYKAIMYARKTMNERTGMTGEEFDKRVYGFFPWVKKVMNDGRSGINL